MEFVILGIVILVVLIVAVAGLVVPRRGRTTLPPSPETAVPTLRTDTEAERGPEGTTEPEAGSGAGGTLVDITGPGLDVPEAAAGRMLRLRSRLSRSQSTLGRGLLSLLSREKLDEDAWEEIEDALLTADVGVASTQEIVERLRTRTRVLGTRTEGELRALLADELVTALQPDLDRTLHTVPHGDGHPAVLLVVGVNGTGKTTTCGKIARLLVADGRTVLLGAADTFRAAAADQLETWAGRVGAWVVRGPEGGDPASVAFEAVKLGTETDDNPGVDTVLIDTAGRLHTKVGLMDELGKIKRVVEKQGPVDETLRWCWTPPPGRTAWSRPGCSPRPCRSPASC